MEPENQQQQELVNKVELSSGKVVLLRQFKIRHQRNAAKAVAGKSGGDANVMAMLIQEEILKNLIHSVDSEMIPANKKEDLDALFSYAEYQQLSMVLGQMMGADGGVMEAPKFEIVSL